MMTGVALLYHPRLSLAPTESGGEAARTKGASAAHTCTHTYTHHETDAYTNMQ